MYDQTNYYIDAYCKTVDQATTFKSSHTQKLEQGQMTLNQINNSKLKLQMRLKVIGMTSIKRFFKILQSCITCKCQPMREAESSGKFCCLGNDSRVNL